MHPLCTKETSLALGAPSPSLISQMAPVHLAAAAAAFPTISMERSCSSSSSYVTAAASPKAGGVQGGFRGFWEKKPFFFLPCSCPPPLVRPSRIACALPQAAVGGDSFLSSSAPLAFASPFPAQLVHSEEPKKEKKKKKKRNPRFQGGGGGQGEVQHQDLLGRDPLRRY